MYKYICRQTDTHTGILWHIWQIHCTSGSTFTLTWGLLRLAPRLQIASSPQDYRLLVCLYPAGTCGCVECWRRFVCSILLWFPIVIRKLNSFYHPSPFSSRVQFPSHWNGKPYGITNGKLRRCGMLIIIRFLVAAKVTKFYQFKLEVSWIWQHIKSGLRLWSATQSRIRWPVQLQWKRRLSCW